LKPKLAEQVADQLMAKDALDAHARDELAWTSAPSPNRSQAAFASALAFSLGEAAPPLTAFLAPQGALLKPSPPPRWSFWPRSAPGRAARRW